MTTGASAAADPLVSQAVGRRSSRQPARTTRPQGSPLRPRFTAITATPRSLRLLGRLSDQIAPHTSPIAIAAVTTLVLLLCIPDTRELGVIVLVLAAALNAAIIPHELAHALAARAAGLTVSRLALGFGPRIFGRTVRGTSLELRLVPAGGFAQIDGLDAAPRPVRVLVALVGPIVNLLLAGVALVAATVAAGAVDPGQAMRAALEIATLFVTGTGELIGAYAADPSNLALLPIAGLPSTALATGVAVDGGLPMLCILVAALSLSTGVVNLLPYPPLDGAIALGAITNRRFGRRSALAVDALLLFVLLVNLGDGIRVASMLAG